jgi:hypothetical protein
MLVRNRTNTLLKYNKSSETIELKPMTVTYVDGSTVTAKELLGTYGSRIQIVSEGGDEPVSKQEVFLVDREKDLTDGDMTNILAEIKAEVDFEEQQNEITLNGMKLSNEEAERLEQEAVEDVEAKLGELVSEKPRRRRGRRASKKAN